MEILQNFRQTESKLIILVKLTKNSSNQRSKTLSNQHLIKLRQINLKVNQHAEILQHLYRHHAYDVFCPHQREMPRNFQ